MINMRLKTAITLINVQPMEGGGRGQGPSHEQLKVKNKTNNRIFQ